MSDSYSDIEMTEPVNLTSRHKKNTINVNLSNNIRIKKVDVVDYLVAKFSVMSLNNKRKIRETRKGHFETFHKQRPYARPYGKKMKA